MRVFTCIVVILYVPVHTALNRPAAVRLGVKRSTTLLRLAVFLPHQAVPMPHQVQLPDAATTRGGAKKFSIKKWLRTTIDTLYVCINVSARSESFKRVVGQYIRRFLANALEPDFLELY